MAIKFVYGAQSQYDKLVEQSQIVEDALYFVNDSQSVYRGSELIVRTPIKFVSEMPEEGQLEKDTLYVVTTVDPETQQAKVEIFTFDGETAEKVTDSEGNIDAEKIFDALAKFTSEDVKANSWDQADDTKVATAGAVKEALTWILLQD